MENHPIEQSISFPKMTIKVDLMGNYSLVGALCERFIEEGYMDRINVLNPEEIIFEVKRVQPEVNLYKELNYVRDMFKIGEKKITLLMQ